MSIAVAGLRSLGVGVARSLNIVAAPHSQSLMSVVTNAPVPVGTVLAAIPGSAITSAATLTDSDTNGFFPPVEEFVACALESGGVGGGRAGLTKPMIECLAVAHFVSLNVYLEPSSWLSQCLGATLPGTEYAFAFGRAEVAALHSSIAAKFVTAPLPQFQAALRFVAASAARLPPPLAEPSGESQSPSAAEASPSSVHLTPFVDLLLLGAPRLSLDGASPTVALRRITVRHVRDCLEAAGGGQHALRGARQMLVGKDDTAPFVSVVAVREIEPNTALLIDLRAWGWAQKP